MHIILNHTSMIPIYEQLVDQLKNHILSGTLAEHAPLPSVRVLSGQLKISALTVKKAYDRLEEEGFVVTVHGKGSFVAPTDRALAAEARRRAVEDCFADAVEKARIIGLDNDEIRQIIELCLEE